MAELSVKTNIDDLLRRMRRKGERFSKVAVEDGMTRIGLLVTQQARFNAISRGVYDSGRLADAIDFRFYGSSGRRILEIGVFGVSYAAVNEFGSNNITDRVRRAMFRTLRQEGKLGDPGKGVMVGNNFKRRPFLMPAYNMNKRKFLAILRDTLRE